MFSLIIVWILQAPVLNLDELNNHQHNQDRQIFQTDSKGYLYPTPAPKLSRYNPVPPPNKSINSSNNNNNKITYSNAYLEPGQHSKQILAEFGYGQSQIEDLLSKGIVSQSRVTAEEGAIKAKL